jgi:hypothetical protein
MADDLPFYSPDRKPTLTKRQPAPHENLWTVCKDHQTWSCELLSHGDWGTEAQISIDGDLLIGRRFETRALALIWAERERPK